MQATARFQPAYYRPSVYAVNNKPAWDWRRNASRCTAPAEIRSPWERPFSACYAFAAMDVPPDGAKSAAWN